MNEHALRNILEGGGGAAGAAARAALWLPGKAYGLAMRARRAMYEHGLFHRHAAPVPVVSVGNITAGGSGKTPFVVMLADHLAAFGHTPAILLRGYRESADGISDEAALYRRACPTALTYAHSNRTASARQAVRDGATILLMDDGFQHLRLRRDLDIVLIDATAPWGGGNTIPGGLLREPPAALANADALVVTRSDQAPRAVPAIRERLAHFSTAPVFTARHKPARLHTLSGETIPLSRLAGLPVAALAGIARPEAFCATLEQLGARIIARFATNDHGEIPPGLVAQAVETAKNAEGVVVTTEKDREKRFLRESTDNIVDSHSIWVLGIEQDMDEKNAFFSLVDKRLAALADSG